MDKVEIVDLPSIKDDGPGAGVLRFFESPLVPFTIQRVFSVVADKGVSRGGHAHISCGQLLICIQGKISLTCDDSVNRELYTLTPTSAGVWIKNTIWGEQVYMEDNTVLIVLCDQKYDEGDYIRNYDEYIEWKRKTA